LVEDFDFFGNGDLTPESEKEVQPLGLVVAARARTKAECGFDELAHEEAIYQAQIKRYGMFTPEFSEEDEDGEHVEVPYRGDSKR
jgi:hypothetical protein